MTTRDGQCCCCGAPSGEGEAGSARCRLSSRPEPPSSRGAAPRWVYPVLRRERAQPSFSKGIALYPSRKRASVQTCSKLRSAQRCALPRLAAAVPTPPHRHTHTPAVSTACVPLVSASARDRMPHATPRLCPHTPHEPWPIIFEST